MSLLAQATYDPAAAVSKATSALLAMTALDATNLACTFAAPANGKVLVRLHSMVTGATTFPRILLGAIESSPSSGTLRGRASPSGQMPTGVATGLMSQDAAYVVTGLTPSTTYTWQMAYGVDILLSSTNLKYGGPNDAVGADAFGSASMEIWSTENLLGGLQYDPTTSVTKVTTSLLAMTAIDTTNARITFTPPASGNVMWRLKAQIHGSTTFGAILLGILSGSTVVARKAPVMANPTTSLATSCVVVEASGIVTGLSGSQTWDAAYGVQVVSGAGGIKYGGPNNTTTNDCFGNICFEVWQC